MKMQIDFYSKDMLSIQIDSSGNNPFQKSEKNELFLFTCYTLRQLSNLGRHLTAKVLAGLLVSNNIVSDLLEGKVELPTGKNLLLHYRSYALSTVSKKQNTEEFFKVSIALNNELRFNSTVMQLFDTNFLSVKPKIVNYNGKSKRTFIVTFPPFLVKTRGFGFLGRDINYYAFHSVIGLISFLGLNYRHNEIFLNNFIQIAQLCGSAYIFQRIPTNQVVMAKTILKQVDI